MSVYKKRLIDRHTWCEQRDLNRFAVKFARLILRKKQVFANAVAFRLAITPGAGKYAEQRIFADPSRSSPLPTFNEKTT